MRYDTETYSLELEIVFTFRNDPSLSRRFKLLHGLSSAAACGVLFSLECAGLHDNAQVRAFHLAVTESVSLKSFFQTATVHTKII